MLMGDVSSIFEASFLDILFVFMVYFSLFASLIWRRSILNIKTSTMIMVSSNNNAAKSPKSKYWVCYSRKGNRKIAIKPSFQFWNIQNIKQITSMTHVCSYDVVTLWWIMYMLQSFLREYSIHWPAIRTNLTEFQRNPSECLSTEHKRPS